MFRTVILFVFLLSFLLCKAQTAQLSAILTKNNVRSAKSCQYLVKNGKVDLADPWIKLYTKYDTNGRVIVSKDLDLDTALIAFEIKSYGLNGQLSFSQFHSQNDTTRSAYRFYQYDAKGRIVKRIDSAMYAKKILQTCYYEYDSTGLNAVESDINAKDEKTFMYEYRYDSLGRIIRSVSYYYRESDKPYVKREYYYDSTGKTIAEDIYLHDMETPTGHVDYFYDENGLLAYDRYYKGKNFASETRMIYSYWPKN